MVSAGADAGLSCDAMSLSFGSPVQIAWVTHDLDATETALTGLLGVKKWVRLPDVHFAPDTCSYLGSTGRLRRQHLAELSRRHAARADRAGPRP